MPVGYYCDEPVRWAVKQGVTSGTSTTTFSPNQTCTQAQILTFLWRAAGEPGAAIDNPYSHIAMAPNQYFYKSMLWAYENGVMTDAGLAPQRRLQAQRRGHLPVETGRQPQGESRQHLPRSLI